MLSNLVIVASNTFLEKKDYLGHRDAERAETPLKDSTALLVTVKEAGWKDLKLAVLAEIRQHEARVVWIVAHMYCFEDTSWFDNKNDARQIRQKRAEEELEADLSLLMDKPKLEIHGFHHDTLVPVWSVLRSKERRESATFVEDLIKALQGDDLDTLFDRLSIVKHQIVRLFLPLDLDLQNWRESQDRQLRERVDGRLANKMQEALSLLDSAQTVAQRAGRKLDSRLVRAVLDIDSTRRAAQQAGSFHRWINELEKALDSMRRTCL